MSKFYIYIHKRKSDDAIFYVGKGSGKRCREAYGRNNLWNKIADKHGFYAEIVADGLSESEAFDIERSLIDQYGRIIDGTGILANFTDGGEGVSGWRGTDSFYKSRGKSLSNALMKPEKRAARVLIAKEMHSRPGFNEAHTKRMQDVSKMPDVVAKKSSSLKATYNTPEMKAWLKENRSGKLNGRYDPTVYCFMNNDGRWFIGDRFDFGKEFNISGSHMSRIVNNGKTGLGWKLTERSQWPI
jgi:hypothetical protein